MKLHLLTIFIMLTSVLEVNAKIFIYHASAEDGQEVWFRNVFNVSEIPDSAMLTLSTSGQILAYINGRIVGTQSIWPYRPIVNNKTMQRRKGVATQTVNVRHLLRTGRNTIAIWYAPCIDVKALTERSDSDSCCVIPGSIYQLSAELTTKKGLKRETLFTPRSNWLCKIAPASITPYGEDIDGLTYNGNWKNTVLAIRPDWIRPEMSWYKSVIWNTVGAEGGYARNTIRAKQNVTNDSTQIFYFPHEETGQLRITIRSAKKGQKLDINGMKYICTGETDEQFFTRFTTVTTDKVTVSNMGNQKFPNIQNIEMIILRQVP